MTLAKIFGRSPQTIHHTALCVLHFCTHIVDGSMDTKVLHFMAVLFEDQLVRILLFKFVRFTFGFKWGLYSSKLGESTCHFGWNCEKKDDIGSRVSAGISAG